MNRNTKISQSGQQSGQGGYTLLFAVLTAALVLGVAVFILSISTKQYELSASARNSIYSFYAADSGVECAAAAYFNLRSGDFVASSTGATVTCGVTSVGAIQTVSVGPFFSALPGYPSFLTGSKWQSDPLRFNLGNGTCAVVTIYDGSDSSNNHYTVFDSRGYNHCTSSYDPDTANPSTVERALRLSKQG